MDSNKFYKPFENNKNEMPKSNYKDVLLGILSKNFETLNKIIPSNEIRKEKDFILKEIDKLEKASNPIKAERALTREVAEKITMLWDFSGPGNYDNAYKDDRYKIFPWSRQMERDRLNYTAWISRKIAERLSGQTDKKSPEETMKLIEEYGPKIFYSATEEENEGVRDLLNRKGVMIPKSKMLIPDAPIVNTRDQIENFSLPEEFHKPGGEIGIISHAPHLVRIMHMIGKFQTMPKDMTIRLFPIATPEDGKKEYAELEADGTLYYIYKDNSASKESYPYIIHGEEK